MERIQKYIDEMQQTLDQLPLEQIDKVIDLLFEARITGKQVFTMGNGGSASTASHFVCDLSKNTRREDLPSFRVIGLTDNIASITAYANDEGYENIFAQQLANLVNPGDVVIGISTSGNSPNVIEAIDLANRANAKTIAFTGFDGGKLGSLADIHVCVPSNSVEQIEDVHLMLEHLICRALREEVRQSVLIRKEFLVDITHELAIQLDLRDLLRQILHLTLNGIGASSGSIMVLNPQGDVVDGALAYAGNVMPQSSQQLAEVFERGLAGWVAENRQAALVSDTSLDPRWYRREWDTSDHSSRSAICVPLMVDDRVVGVLTLVHSGVGRFTQEDVALLTAMTVCMSLVNYTVR
jgi:D-sedoheptulose 7-phosphate isomerase